MNGMRAAALFVVLLLHYCDPGAVLNALAPRDGITTTQDIRYADGPRHTLDVYAPPRHASPVPVVVFFYGGGWETGDKAMYRYVGASLAAGGVLAIIPDYRLHPAVVFPAFVEDAARAIAWAHANAARFGGDPHRVFLMGHSAGAQIAALVALDPAYLRAVGLPADAGCVRGDRPGGTIRLPAGSRPGGERGVRTARLVASRPADQLRDGARAADAAGGWRDRPHRQSGQHAAPRRSVAAGGRQRAGSALSRDQPQGDDCRDVDEPGVAGAGAEG